jgi:hypothetical protein
MTISRRLFLTGLLAAPVIVRAGVLMPVRPVYSMAAFREEFLLGFEQMRERLINPPLILHASQAARFAHYDALLTAWQRHQDVLMMAALDVPLPSNNPLAPR